MVEGDPAPLVPGLQQSRCQRHHARLQHSQLRKIAPIQRRSAGGCITLERSSRFETEGASKQNPSLSPMHS
jgi:hypothetical protein